MAKTFSWIFGVVFLVFGLLAYFPNSFIGEGAFFEANMAHSWIHIVTGALFIIIALFASAYSSGFMKIAGLVYLIVAILGLIGNSPVLGFIGVNDAGDFLNLVLGIIMGLVGIMAGRKTNSSPVVM